MRSRPAGGTSKRCVGEVSETRVVIAGGGTGGHLYPGVAVARELLRRRPDAQVTFAGTARGLEATLVPKEGFELDVIRSAGLKGRSIVKALRGLAMVPVSLADAWALVSRRRPTVVVGVGGYSSGPVVLIAWLRGIPTMLLEQNAVPGLTNRLLARVVRAAALTYDDVNNYFGRKAFVTGNPVRPEFFTPVITSQSSIPNGLRVLILGGSQGAHAINVAMVAASAELVRRHAGLQVVHQTGQRDLAVVREGYERAGVGARAESFLDGVAGEMKLADLVICRAGATTLAELAAVGRPAVLVPLPGATDDHQRKNAEALATAGAAVLLEQETLTPDSLASTVSALLNARDRLARMADAMKQFARPDAAARIVDRLMELAA
ncbi:MAG: undecaprenyldiphospho-muramoylpentapeptide beta-N-acetylglucosaminyltransferase [Acidobacteria bacterium]|nr:MAG: undecaprenyldiphospho-muramoylpentapeptide beta-N-acetylglucosaminyltransferase [Acidobacteriota bacterium]